MGGERQKTRTIDRPAPLWIQQEQPRLIYNRLGTMSMYKSRNYLGTRFIYILLRIIYKSIKYLGTRFE